MSSNPAKPSAQGVRVTVDLSAADVERLDGWIAAQPEPRPSQGEALRRLGDLGIYHGREVEMTRERIQENNFRSPATGRTPLDLNGSSSMFGSTGKP